MRSKALLSKSALLKTTAVGNALPIRIGDLDGCVLVSHCDRCGRHLQLYPGHADFSARTRVASLLERVVCGARRSGRSCGGLPRRLLLVREERQWALDASGGWVEDQSLFWEPSDFEAGAEQGSMQAAA
jgi:hypothetical protein